MNNRFSALLLAGLISFGFCMCSAGGSQGTAKTATKAIRQIPQFDADSAYCYVAGQIAFGPRVPGTPAQQSAAQWLENELRRHGATVYIQHDEATAYDGTRLPIINIVGSFNPEAKSRVLLMAHWDCRHISDNDPDQSKYNTPVDGANDGASGVGILLEIARQAGMNNPKARFLSVSSIRPTTSKARTRRHGGHWALRPGAASLMSMVTVPITAYYSIWWEPKMQHSTANTIPTCMHATL